MQSATIQQMTVQVDKGGRLDLPPEHRAALGVEEGGTLLISLEDGEVRLRTVRSVIAEAQAFAARFLGAAGDSVDRFIAEKRAEAAFEE